MAALRLVGNRRPRVLPWLSLVMLCLALNCSARWVVARAAPVEHTASLACVPGPHQGNLTTSQDWCPQDNPHVVTFWSAVTSGVTLTLRPGVEVRFPVGGYLSVMGGATLLAEGTPAQPIVLTSGSASPLAGDWQYLDIQRNARARLAYCDLAYGGRTGSNLRIESSDVEVRNCRIHHGKDTGLYINGAGLTPLIQDSQIDHVSGHAIYQDWVNAAPVYRNLALTDNGTDGLVLQGGTIDRDLTFDGPGSLNGKPFYLNSITLASGYTLAVTPGTALRVAVAGRLTVNDRATLLAEGTVTRPITFTSWAATPQPGDWTFSLDGTVRLAHCDVSASGRGGWGGLEAAGNLWMRACRMHGNAGRAISASVDRLYLAYTQMDDNPQGLTNLTPAQAVVARNNWWGHASGPYNSKLNPSGQGLAVSDGVAFEPWLGTYNWLAPFRDLLHGTEWLQWAALGTDPGQVMTVDVLAFQSGQQHTLGTGLPRSGYLAWNTTLVAGGIWELQALFRDGAGQVVGQAVRKVGVNNSPQVAYHGGWLHGNETWTTDRVHVIDDDVFVTAGVTLTLQSGVVLKFNRDTGLTVRSGGVLVAPATAAAPIVLTTLADDTAGGDTNLDGALSLPLPGDWSGLGVDAGGQADLNNWVELRYVSTTHSGTLTRSETWPGSQLHHITGDVIVPNGVNLTIQAGATVKSDAKKAITVRSGGQLTVLGSVAKPVVLTSIRDDSAGDSNGDGGATTAAPGDWLGIYINGGVASLDHANILYGGGSAGTAWNNSGALRADSGARVTVTNSLLDQSLFDGVLAQGGPLLLQSCVVASADRGLVAWLAAAAVTVRNSTFDDNRIGLLAHGGTLDVANTIVANSLEAGIDRDILPDPTVRYSNVWSSSGVSYRRVADPTGQNGNLSLDPGFRDVAKGNYRLRYTSPMIDAAQGTLAPATDAMGAPRYDDPRTPNTGLPTAGGAYADIGAYEFVETAPSNIDLAVTQVSGPLTATAGQTVTVHWIVANLGSQPAVGPWHDTVALGSVDVPTPTLLIATEVLAGEGVTLGPGRSIQVQATVRVPGGMVGDYYWYVEANTAGEVFEGRNRDDNLSHSSARVALDVPELTVGGPALARQFSASGEAHWFRFQGSQGQSVRVVLDSQASTGAVELYVGGLMPTRQEYQARSHEWNSPDATLVAAGTFSQTYYVLAHANALPSGPSAFSIRAMLVPFSVVSVLPRTVGNAGLVTLDIGGGGLISGTHFSLVASGGTRVPALRVSSVDPSRAFASFDLTGFPAGPADLEVELDGTAAMAWDAVQVQAGGLGEFYAELSGPSALRAGRTGTWYITYGNRGLVDIPLPLLKFSVPGALEMHLYQHVDNWADSIVFLALNQDSRLPTLGPGQEATVAVEVLPGGSSNTIQARLEHIPGEQAAQDPTPFHWDELPVPEGMDPAVWQAEVDLQTEVFGETVGEFYAVLMADLDVLAQQRLPYAYVVNANGRWLLGPEPVMGPFVELGHQEEVPGHDAAVTDVPFSSQSSSRPPDGRTDTHYVVITSADYAQRYSGSNLPMVDAGNENMMQLIQQDLRTHESRITNLHDKIGKSDDDLTKWRMLQAITDLEGKLDADDNLVVYFLGHGDVDSGVSRLLVNAKGDDGEVTPAELQWAFDKVGAGHTYFIADACHSGGMDEIKCTNTALVGMFSTARDKRAMADRAGGGLFSNELKAYLRLGQDLQQAFDLTDSWIWAFRFWRWDPVNRQDPQLYNPSGVNLRSRPWGNAGSFFNWLKFGLRTLLWTGWSGTATRYLASSDPNDKIGPAGVQGYVGFDPLLPYTVRFENQRTATAPAQEVVVTDQLDPSLDLSTLQLTRIGFNDVVLDIPPGLDHYDGVAQVGSDSNPVHVTAALDLGTRAITWTIRSVDPATQKLPEDPYAGFLPPNDDAHHGEGFVAFTVRPLSGLAQGTPIRNGATIVFDINPPISTNRVLNTIGEPPPGIYLPVVLRRW